MRKLGKARQREEGGQDDCYFSSSGQEGLDKKITRAEVNLILR